MLLLAGKCDNLQTGKDMILENIKNGEAFNKFKELVANQGGDVSYLEDTDKFEKAAYIKPIIAHKSGVVTKLDALNVGKLSCSLGAGRITKESEINHRVGFTFNKKVGDTVSEGETLGFVHADDEKKADDVLSKEIFEIN
jgi:pyrimidine-nucleoside phosphorylase